MAQNPLLSDFDSTSTGRDLIPVTPNDGADLEVAARGIRCRPDGVAGALRITTWTGEVRDTYIDAGESLIVAVIRVHDTGTDATKLEVYI